MLLTDPFTIDLNAVPSMSADEQHEVLAAVEHHLDLATATHAALLALHSQVAAVVLADRVVNLGSSAKAMVAVVIMGAAVTAANFFTHPSAVVVLGA